MGNVVAELETNDIVNNTLILFTGDNGPWMIRGKSGGSEGLVMVDSDQFPFEIAKTELADDGRPAPAPAPGHPSGRLLLQSAGARSLGRRTAGGSKRPCADHF